MTQVTLTEQISRAVLRAIELYWLESGKLPDGEPENMRSEEGRIGKETIVADSPQNPGSQGPPAPPPYQPVQSQYQPAAYQPGAAPPGYGAPVPAPVQKSGGSSAVKIILIIVGIFVFLGVMVVAVIGYGVYRVRKAIHVDGSTGAATLSVPGMSMNADPGMKFTASELGTEIYPGAEPKKSGSMRMSIAGSSVVSAAFLTSDPEDKVVAFYKDKLGSNATSMEFGGTSILTSKMSDHEQVSVTIVQQSSQQGGRTQIQIQHTKSAQGK
jgi:hypothetical protein